MHFNGNWHGTLIINGLNNFVSYIYSRCTFLLITVVACPIRQPRKWNKSGSPWTCILIAKLKLTTYGFLIYWNLKMNYFFSINVCRTHSAYINKLNWVELPGSTLISRNTLSKCFAVKAYGHPWNLYYRIID